jgi:hypothetical protein
VAVFVLQIALAKSVAYRDGKTVESVGDVLEILGVDWETTVSRFGDIGLRK